MEARSSALKRPQAATRGERTGKAPESRERRSDTPPATSRRFVSGETLLYLGRQYRLRVVEDPVHPTPRLFGGCLHVPGGLAWGPDGVERHVVGWYRERCEHHFPDRVAYWAERLGVEAPAILISASQSDWASCDTNGAICISWKIIQAPKPLIDYVVAHELVHLEAPGHTPAFWKTLGRVMPDYEGRRARLKDLGSNLFVLPIHRTRTRERT